MTKRIKSTSELPNWFQLEKYEFTEKIKAVGWYEQLYARTIIIFDAEKVITYPEFSLPDRFLSFKSAVQAIQENPNIDITSDIRLSNRIPLGAVLPQLKYKNPHHMLSIHSLTLKDYVIASQFVDNNKLEYAFDWLNSNTNKPPVSELPTWMNKPLMEARVDAHNGYCDYLSICLGLPDELLMANFEQYISHARKKGLVPWSKAYSLNDFKNWAELQVLAYADLSLWAKLSNITIPCRVMADAIFPDGTKGEETVRKTVKPLATKLLHNDTWNQLGFQAGLEIQEELHELKLANKNIPEK